MKRDSRTRATMTVSREAASEHVWFGRPVVRHSDIDVDVSADVDGYEVHDIQATYVNGNRQDEEFTLTAKEIVEAEAILLEVAKDAAFEAHDRARDDHEQHQIDCARDARFDE